MNIQIVLVVLGSFVLGYITAYLRNRKNVNKAWSTGYEIGASVAFKVHLYRIVAKYNLRSFLEMLTNNFEISQLPSNRGAVLIFVPSHLIEFIRHFAPLLVPITTVVEVLPMPPDIKGGTTTGNQ